MALTCIVCGKNVHARSRRWLGMARWREGIGTKARGVETESPDGEKPEPGCASSEWPLIAVCLQPCLGQWAEAEIAEWEIALRRIGEGLPEL